jgi:hypothetical protein
VLVAGVVVIRSAFQVKIPRVVLTPLVGWAVIPSPRRGGMVCYDRLVRDHHIRRLAA